MQTTLAANNRFASDTPYCPLNAPSESASVRFAGLLR